uniref:Metaxin-2 n=1 Tax=Acrobeloides nanus TaxID=290746 RepID=A0A914C212_9BILA
MVQEAMNLGGEWTDVSLFTPYQNEQALLYEYADCVGARAFLKMAGLPFRQEQRPNAEFMSPLPGKVPFLKLPNALVAEFDGIVDAVTKRGVKLSSTLTDAEIADMQAHIALINDVLKHAEMSIVWLDNATYKKVTRNRYGSVYFWPLNSLLPILKHREMSTYLKNVGWGNKSIEEIVKLCDRCFRSLSVKLGQHNYFVGDQPTELDALAFGHLYTILTTELPNMDLVNTLKKYPNLIAFCRRIDEEFFAAQ